MAVVETGSLVGASRALRFPRATLRRRLDELEVRLGVPLLSRTDEGLVPTSAGRVLVEKARLILRDVGALVSSVREVPGDHLEPTGQLDVAMQVGMPTDIVSMGLGLMRQQFPRLTVSLWLDEDPLSRLSDVDLALFFGDQPALGPWHVVELFTAQLKLLASAEYLEQHGVPRSVEELASHQVALWHTSSAEPGLPLRDGRLVPFEPQLSSTDAHLLHRFAHQSRGIVLAPINPAVEALSGLPPLRVVLDETVGRPITMHLAAPSALSELPRIQAVFRAMRALLGLPP
ncbi:MAG: LysR family transcriptional regulator [Myxococcaceae bacterium]|nr:LysR family transcriptional regulator [Myxococcaceae bacterium]